MLLLLHVPHLFDRPLDKMPAAAAAEPPYVSSPINGCPKYLACTRI